MTTNRPLRVFLCHSSADKPAVRELYQKLRAESWIDPWLDEEKLYPGEDWDLAIQRAVEESDIVVVCLSNNSITKRGYIQKELRYVVDLALEMPEEEIFIIPLRLEECTPPRSLREWQYADYFEGRREQAIERLLTSLRKRADSLGLTVALVAPKVNEDVIQEYLNYIFFENESDMEEINGDKWKEYIESLTKKTASLIEKSPISASSVVRQYLNLALKISDPKSIKYAFPKETLRILIENLGKDEPGEEVFTNSFIRRLLILDHFEKDKEVRECVRTMLSKILASQSLQAVLGTLKPDVLYYLSKYAEKESI